MITVGELDKKLTALREREDAREKVNDRHAMFNTIFILAVICFGLFAYFKVPDVKFEYDYRSEVNQLIIDEGMRLKPYKDTLGNATIGFGHLIEPGESFTSITTEQAIDILIEDYNEARYSVEKSYPWAEGDVKLVLINMTFQMGPSRLAKFEKSLMAMQIGDYKLAAAELLNSVWASQTPKRAQRLAGRILQLDNSYF